MRITYFMAAAAVAGIAVWNAQVGWDLHPSQPEEALGNFLGSVLLLALSGAIAWHALAQSREHAHDDGAN